MLLKKCMALLTITSILLSCISCARGEHGGDIGGSQADCSSDAVVQPRTLENVLDGVYAVVMPKFDVRTTRIDLGDEDMLRYYTGLDDASLVEEAIVSEAKDDSHAYSLAIVKLKDASRAAELAKQMKSAVDASRFAGKTIDTKESVAVGDMVLLLMDGTHKDSLVSGDIIDAFRDQFRVSF